MRPFTGMTMNLRKVWLSIHRWIGLTLGVLFLFSGLTGSCLVFRHDLDEHLNSHMMLTQNQGSPRALDEILAGAEALSPSQGRITNLFFPRVSNGVYSVQIRTGDKPNPAEDVEVFIDPVTGEILGQRKRSSGVLAIVYRLHSTLLAGKPGEMLLGGFAVALLGFVISGLMLWWPLVRRGLRIGLGVRRRMLIYDLHKSFGAIFSPIFLLVLLTGVYLGLPGLVKPIVTQFSPETKLPGKVKSVSPSAGTTPIGPAAAVQVALETMPGCRPMSIELPLKPDDSYRVFVRQAGEVGELRGVGRVWVDQFTGKCLATRDWNQFTFADTFFRIQLALHSGDAFGLFGRWIVFLGGFAPTLLYLTGFTLWRKRVRRTSASHNGSSLDLTVHGPGTDAF